MPTRPTPSRACLSVEILESRQLLHAGPMSHTSPFAAPPEPSPRFAERSTPVAGWEAADTFQQGHHHARRFHRHRAEFTTPLTVSASPDSQTTQPDGVARSTDAVEWLSVGSFVDSGTILDATVAPSEHNATVVDPSAAPPTSPRARASVQAKPRSGVSAEASDTVVLGQETTLRNEQTQPPTGTTSEGARSELAPTNKVSTLASISNLELRILTRQPRSEPLPTEDRANTSAQKDVNPSAVPPSDSVPPVPNDSESQTSEGKPPPQKADLLAASVDLALSLLDGGLNALKDAVPTERAMLPGWLALSGWAMAATLAWLAWQRKEQQSQLVQLQEMP